MRARLLACAAAAVLALAAGLSAAADADRTKEKNIQAGYEETKDLLKLMDKDKNGKVSKKEFMSFMEAEFERLDKDKNGELDVNELEQIRIGKHTGGTGGR